MQRKMPIMQPYSRETITPFTARLAKKAPRMPGRFLHRSEYV